MEKSSFFNSVSGDRKYKAEEWAAYFASFIGNGVFPSPSNGLQVVADSGMMVKVKAGKAWINGYFYRNTDDLLIPLSTPDGALKRIDRVVVRWDLSSRKISAVVKSSQPSASPIAPALQRDADAYELCLGDILVGAGVTNLSQASITDQRLNSALCGVAAGLIEQIDTESFNAQLQAWFQDYANISRQEYEELTAYMESLKASGDKTYASLQAYMEAFETDAEHDFNTWLEGIQNVLDEDTAGHLLSLISAVTKTADNAIPKTEKRAPNGVAALDETGVLPASQGGTGASSLSGITVGNALKLNNQDASFYATAQEVNAAIPKTEKGAPNGVASLNASGILPVSQGGTGASSLSGITVGNATKLNNQPASFYASASDVTAKLETKMNKVNHTLTGLTLLKPALSYESGLTYCKTEDGIVMIYASFYVVSPSGRIIFGQLPEGCFPNRHIYATFSQSVGGGLGNSLAATAWVRAGTGSLEIEPHASTGNQFFVGHFVFPVM